MRGGGTGFVHSGVPKALRIPVACLQKHLPKERTGGQLERSSLAVFGWAHLREWLMACS